MTKMMSTISAVLVALAMSLGSGPALAAEGTGPADQQNWSFAGLFGTYDENQLQRGFKVYREVCASCHGAELMAFRTLAEEGGPHFSEAQVEALAAEYTISDPDAEGGERDGLASDYWPDPFESDRIARDANGGALPPDFSVLAKARTISQDFPYWVFNYFTAYQEGGPDYIYNLLTSYGEPPEGEDVPAGQHWNDYLHGTLAMAPPLQDGFVTYEGEAVPETVEQYSRDVAAFMMWLAEPHLADRKAMGFRVIIFLIVFAGLMYMVKRRLWSKAH